MRFILTFITILFAPQLAGSESFEQNFCNAYDATTGISEAASGNYSAQVNPFPNPDITPDRNAPFYEVIISEQNSNDVSNSYWFNDGDLPVTITLLDTATFCETKYVVLTVQFEPSDLSETKQYSQTRLFFNSISLEPAFELFDETNKLLGRTISSDALKGLFDVNCSGDAIQSFQMRN